MKLLDNALNRHLLQLVGVVFLVGVAWATSQADIENIKGKQADTGAAVEEIKKAITDIKVDAGVTRNKVDNVEKQVDEINRKLDTLLWRSSPERRGTPSAP